MRRSHTHTHTHTHGPYLSHTCLLSWCTFSEGHTLRKIIPPQIERMERTYKRMHIHTYIHTYIHIDFYPTQKYVSFWVSLCTYIKFHTRAMFSADIVLSWEVRPHANCRENVEAHIRRGKRHAVSGIHFKGISLHDFLKTMFEIHISKVCAWMILKKQFFKKRRDVCICMIWKRDFVLILF
jgi:hypothetical protein